MKTPIAALVLALALPLGAHAQTATPAPSAPPAATQPGNSAVKTPSTPTPAAPVAGANSFTEGQAKSRIEGQGFTEVKDLKKDDQGVWRAMAMKDGASKSVSLDFQGNVVAK